MGQSRSTFHYVRISKVDQEAPGPFRKKIANGSILREQDKMPVESVMRKFMQSSLQIGKRKAEKLAILTDE